MHPPAEGDDGDDEDGDYIPDHEERDQFCVEPTEEEIDKNGYFRYDFVVNNDNRIEWEDASTENEDDTSDTESTSGDEDNSADSGTFASTKIRGPSLSRSPSPDVPPRTLRRSPLLQAQSKPVHQGIHMTSLRVASEPQPSNVDALAKSQARRVSTRTRFMNPRKRARRRTGVLQPRS
ncbi:hypothetical protein PQX77_000286 [Marasmius sp. AFHP31]|nr:hypothetical protein PQX77_000286 [Marasmius sp. AFHP31]